MVTLTLEPGSTQLATLSAGSHGDFTDTVTIPSGTTGGDHTIMAACDGQYADLTVAVVTGGTDPTPTTTSSLAFTGADIFGICLIGAGLLVGGGVLVMATRRRRNGEAS